VTEHVAKSHYLVVHRTGVEPGTSWSPVQHATVTSPNRTTDSVQCLISHKCMSKLSYMLWSTHYQWFHERNCHKIERTKQKSKVAVATTQRQNYMLHASKTVTAW